MSTCGYEDELIDAIQRGYVGEELDAHVTSCTSCSELRVVAGAVLDDRSQAMLEAPIPSAGMMLLRMRMRERQEAESTARRSLLIGQAVTLTVAIALVVSFFGATVAVEVRNFIMTIRLSTPLLLVLATSVLLTPVAGWVVTRQK